MNKKVQMVLNWVFIIALGYLLFMQQMILTEDEKQDVEIENSEDATAEASAINVRYVNSDSIWSKYELVDELRANLENKQEEYRSNIEGRIASFQKEVEDFQKNAATMSQFEGQQKQQELVSKEEELRKLQEDLSIELMDMEDKMKKDLRKSILDYLKRYQEKEVDLILDYSISSSVLMVEDSLNITNEVLSGLNEEYKNSKKEEK